MFLSNSELFLTKLLPIAVYPLGLAFVLVLAGLAALLMQRRLTGLAACGSAVILLWVCSMPVLGDWALRTLEREYPARAIEDTVSADVAIVLGGALGQPVPPRTSIHLAGASDRILHAARLYRSGKVKRILVSGGNMPSATAVKPEAELIKELLVEWGVPEAVVETAGRSRNTYENALEIRELRERSPFASALLVTSAAHMPRAMAVFRRAGLPVTASTTDVEVIDASPSSLMAWLPDAGALVRTTAAAKEWLGYWAYRQRRYL